MKNYITLIICAATLVVGANNSFAQPAAATKPVPPEAPDEPVSPPYAARLDTVKMDLAGLSGNTAGQTFVIPKDASDTKILADTEEDLNVMGHILDKAASGRDDKWKHAMGIAIRTGPFGSGAAPRNLYIEGHGAIFFLTVRYPLLPPATKASEPESKDNTSSEWEEARRELYQTPGSGFEFKLSGIPGFDGGAEEYDADKVEELKKELLGALKNAAHIRKLRGDETVTVVVSGRDVTGAGGSKTVKRKSGSGGGAGGSSGGSSSAWPTTRVGTDGRGTKLILRSRKSDIESFQKEKLNLDEFRKKVTMIVY